MSKLTINEARKKKKELEQEIFDLITAFEEETKTRVEDVELTSFHFGSTNVPDSFRCGTVKLITKL